MASLLGVLVQHRDGGLGASVEEFDVQDYELLEADVERLAELALLVHGDHLEEPVVEVKADDATLGVDDADLSALGGTSDAIGEVTHGASDELALDGVVGEDAEHVTLRADEEQVLRLEGGLKSSIVATRP